MKIAQENSAQVITSATDEGGSNLVFKGWKETVTILRREDLMGTWKREQLQELQNEFNNLSSNDEKQRCHILQSFFGAQIIKFVLIDKQKFVSERALTLDMSLSQLSKLNRAQIMSDCLMPFSDMRFEPVSEKKELKHDAHVRSAALQKVPPPYQRKYVDEPQLLIAVEWEEEKGFHIAIKHLVKTSGFCHCVKLTHRETLRAIPLKEIRRISMQLNSGGSYNLHIETGR